MPRFRLDRAFSIALAHPASQMMNGHRQPRVPILMYHGVRAGLRDAHPYFETNISPELFAAQMQFLADNGYTTIDLNHAASELAIGSGLRKKVVITFDDGYRDFYTHAFPVLAEHRFSATMFIVSGLTQDKTASVGDNEYMTWAEVKDVHTHGIRIGSHTVSHPELYSLAPEKVEGELRQSKHTIEDRLGVPVTTFAYPYAFPEQDPKFVRMLRDCLQSSGYEAGVSTIIGTARREHDSYFLPRLPVNAYDDLRFFQVKLEGGYDWLHSFQYARKRVKSVI